MPSYHDHNHVFILSLSSHPRRRGGEPCEKDGARCAARSGGGQGSRSAGRGASAVNGPSLRRPAEACGGRCPAEDAEFRRGWIPELL